MRALVSTHFSLEHAFLTQEMILYSKPLHSLAWKHSQEKGRGCLLQLWPSVDQASDRSAQRPTLIFLNLEETALLEYEPAVISVVEYEPASMFVVVVVRLFSATLCCY